MKKQQKLLYSIALSALTLGNLTGISYASSSDVSLLNNSLDAARQAKEDAKNTPFNNFRREITKQYAEDGLTVTPNDPKGPFTLDGNNIVYNTVNGEYSGTGNVKVTHNFSRIQSDDIKGNTNSGIIDIPTTSHMMQLSDPKIDVTSATTKYDYEKHVGELTKVEGKIDNNYIKGDKIELDGGNYVVYDGILTRCSCENPPYYIHADKITVTPTEATFYHPQFVLNGKVFYSTEIYRVKLNSEHKERREGNSWFPFKFRYSNKNGLTAGYNYDHKLADKTFAYAELRYSTKKSFHNIYGVSWNNGPELLKVESGKYEDSNNHWLTKKYSFIYDYNHRFGTTPFNYRFHNEYGLWKENNIQAHHREHTLTIHHDPINIDSQGKYTLYPEVGYKIIKEDHPGGDKKGLEYSATLLGRFSPEIHGYVGYHYSRTDVKNSLFKFGENDLSKEFAVGIGYDFTPIDRFIIASEFDASKAMSLRHLDYYWIHDFHFMSTELRYEQKDKKIGLHFNFYDF